MNETTDGAPTRTNHNGSVPHSLDGYSQSEDAHRAAIQCATAGLSVVPVNPKTKKPFGEWKRLQTDPDSPEVIANWPKSRRTSFAVICGTALGRIKDGKPLFLVCFDFDVEGFYPKWKIRTGDLSDGMPTQKTGGGGFQVFCLTTLEVHNEKLAFAPCDREEEGREIAIETRGQGGYAVIPPSLHPNGDRYRWTEGDLLNIPVFSEAHTQSLLDAGRALDEAPKTKKELEADQRRAENSKVEGRATSGKNGKVIDAFNAQYTIEAALERFGYKRRGDRYVRPGGENGTVAVLDNGSFHHNTNDPLHSSFRRDAFDVYRIMEHGGNIRDAVKAAAQELGLNLTKKIVQQQDSPPNEAFVHTQKNQPTHQGVAATAQALSAKIDATLFPDLCAREIPAPALQNGEKIEYDPHQIRELLYPQHKAVSLCTERAHAERAAYYISNDIVFCPGLGFLNYEEAGGYWRTDDKEGSLTAAKLAALAPIIRAEAAALLRHAATLATDGRDADSRAMSRGANIVLGHAKQVEKRSFLSGTATFLAAYCRADAEEFAPKPWKFAFKNRVFDCGKWRPAQRDDFFLSVSPVELHGGIDRREWLALLERIIGGDSDFERTLQDACAYALSGASSLRTLIWAYGTKGTGKGTICELLQTVLGDASATIDTALLQDNSSRERLGAQIWGKRAAFVAEAGNKRIDAELLKTLSGADRYSVRRLYQEAFTAKPTHALFLAANDAPKTDAYDDALKDRVIALPFVHPLNQGAPLQFTGHTKVESARLDPNSPLLRGFAAWLGDGLERLYKSQEIHRGPSVEAATAKFWADTDPVTEFWTTVEPDDFTQGIAKAELRRRYEAWCEKGGARPLRARDWTRACQAQNLQSERRSGSVHFWFKVT